MNINSVRNYDILTELPTDEIPLSEREMQVINMLFKNNNNLQQHHHDKKKDISSSSILYEVIVIIILFVLISLPHLNGILPLNKNDGTFDYLTLLIKAGIIGLLFWLLKFLNLPKYFK